MRVIGLRLRPRYQARSSRGANRLMTCVMISVLRDCASASTRRSLILYVMPSAGVSTTALFLSFEIRT